MTTIRPCNMKERLAGYGTGQECQGRVAFNWDLEEKKFPAT